MIRVSCVERDDWNFQRFVLLGSFAAVVSKVRGRIACHSNARCLPPPGMICPVSPSLHSRHKFVEAGWDTSSIYLRLEFKERLAHWSVSRNMTIFASARNNREKNSEFSQIGVLER